MAIGPANDFVTLESQDYYITGPVKGEALSEFEDGFKIGKATYDTREHAFFQVLDDFSGGFGHRRLDIHEDLGTYWDSDRNSSPDLARKGHITLGWPSTVVTPTVVNQSNMSKRNPSAPCIFMADNAYCIGFGNKIYRTTDGITFAIVGSAGADAAELQSFVEFVENTGVITYLAFFSSITESTTGTAQYLVSTNTGATWHNGAKNYVLHDGIYWDNKVMAAFGRGIIFATITAGVETWNIDVVGDLQPIAAVPHGHIHFLGIANAPFGQPSVYFTDEANMWVLDFPVRKAYQIDTGLAGHYITASCQWRGNFYLSDGWNIMEFDPATQQVHNIGFPRADGLPPSMRAVVGTFTITALAPSEGSLHAVVSQALASPQSTLFQYRGEGWSQIGGSTAIFSHVCFSMTLRNAFLSSQRYFYILGAPTLTSTSPTLVIYNLPGAGHVPVVGVDSFAAGPANFTVGWMDGGFLEVYGAALRMYCDAFNLTATETVRVDYQIDNLENSAWQQMTNSTGSAAVFDNTHSVLYFGALRGIQFKTIRFRISLNRGSDSTLSPELRGLSFVYFKKPSLRMGWVFTVDTTRMIKEKVIIGGSATATFANILASIQGTWGEQILVPFSIPSVLPNAYVMLNHLNVEADNIRVADNIPAQGKITVSLLEPVI